ncbi:MAG TPA: nitroreductase family protein [Candidatus Limnocylindrales bacterium]|nr:nitroreductase family protein [Candidatus Limnocylindrales bacterium]
MTNPVFEAVRTLLAVREYQDRAIAEDTVRRIVEAGRLTASSKNGQPWHFVVVRQRQNLREIGALARTGPYIATAGMAIAVAIEKTSAFGVSDASRAIQSMMLTAWAEGVGSNWVGFVHFGGLEAIAKKLGLPDDYDLLAVIPFGYPKRAIGKGQKNRKPLRDVASSEHFGTPFE